jgi:hypothetical protein
MCLSFVKGFVEAQESAKVFVHELEKNAAWRYKNYHSNSSESM